MKRIAKTTLIVLGLIGVCAVVYLHIFSAGFVGFDDDIHVYANPFLNPPTLDNVAKLWQQSYERLYVPLAYTIFAAIARFAQVPAHLDGSLGRTVSLAPVAFHVASIAFHIANTLLCFLLVRRLTRRAMAALFATLVFALHPLQMESVGWISELRGLCGGFFALTALYALVLSRGSSDATPGKSRVLLAASALFVMGAMLCKPSAMVLPLVALAIDRTVLGTPWRRALAAASMWAACALPFAWMTRSIQATSAAGESLWWQRPFVAGDALAFYLFKTFVPIDLCVDYGRTPRWVMSHAWGTLAWTVPVGLLVVCYRNRQRRPITWLGVLMFVTFLLPTLGLVPFTYQAYSTVADRYAYLALIGLGLMLADAVDYVRPQRVVVGVVSVALVALAALSFNQSRYWRSSLEFLHHTIDVNPDAAFAYHNLGDQELVNGSYAAALADYQTCLKHDATLFKTYVMVAEVYALLNQPAEAEAVLVRSRKTPGLTADGMGANDYARLGNLLMKLHQPDRALWALSTAAEMDPSSPKYACDVANALSAVGQLDRAEAAFRSCISRLQPNDPAVLDNLKKAERLKAERPIESQGR